MYENKSCKFITNWEIEKTKLYAKRKEGCDERREVDKSLSMSRIKKNAEKPFCWIWMTTDLFTRSAYEIGGWLKKTNLLTNWFEWLELCLCNL